MHITHIWIYEMAVTSIFLFLFFIFLLGFLSAFFLHRLIVHIFRIPTVLHHFTGNNLLHLDHIMAKTLLRIEDNTAGRQAAINCLDGWIAPLLHFACEREKWKAHSSQPESMPW